MEYLKKFEELSKDIFHGNSSYFDHSYGVYKILKELNSPEYIFLAGLFHSIYDTEYFKTNISITRQEISSIIGNKSENLVFKFCNIRNRYENILNNYLNFDKQTHKDLCLIEYANLKEQSKRVNDNILIENCLKLQEKINFLESNNIQHYTINGKKLYIFDELLEKNHIEFLNQYCYNSVYRPNHRSNNSPGYDSRFASVISPQEFEQTKLIPIIKEITKNLNFSLYIGHHYINHYGLMTTSAEHCDGDFEGLYTILIFPNNIWGKNWGGEIAFYGKDKIHNMIEYIPGRIILFDSRISHKVLPINRNSQLDRYSIAIKTCNDNGLSSFEKIYKPYLKIEQ